MTYAKLSGALLARKDPPVATTLAQMVSVPHVPEPAPAPTPLAGESGRMLAQYLRALKLPTFAAEHEKLARQCNAEGLDPARFLLRLAELELAQRERQVVERRVKEARFPGPKELDSFDFTALPGLDRTLVVDLARCDFIARHENVIALGDSGTGKTHLAVALGLAACRKGFSARFVTAAALARELIETHDQRRLTQLQRRLMACKLLIVDELGYVPLPPAGAELLFEVISHRYERGATIVTSNLGFDAWASVFGSPGLAHAAVERLTHRSHILDMHGESYRQRQGGTGTGQQPSGPVEI